jgi:hypothetical protein
MKLGVHTSQWGVDQLELRNCALVLNPELAAEGLWLKNLRNPNQNSAFHSFPPPPPYFLKFPPASPLCTTRHDETEGQWPLPQRTGGAARSVAWPQVHVFSNCARGVRGMTSTSRVLLLQPIMVHNLICCLVAARLLPVSLPPQGLRRLAKSVVAILRSLRPRIEDWAFR